MATASASERKAAIQRATNWFNNRAEPTWEIAELYPAQGTWSEEDYLAIHSNRRIEFENGRLEFLPVPTMSHEEIVMFLFDMLRAFVRPQKLGRVFFAGIRVYTTATKYRVPDVVFMKAQHAERMRNEAWQGADLVMEVVSVDDPDRDWVKKRREYARAGIAEYWVVDPQKKEIAVFTLKGTSYAVHGRFKAGQQADSVLLPKFGVEVHDVFFGEKQ